MVDRNTAEHEEQASTIERRNFGLVIATKLEDLKNRLKAEGRREDADVVRVARQHVKDYLGDTPLPVFRVPEPADGWRSLGSFSEEEKRRLRPMAETIAMLDGNAFFGMKSDDAGDDIAWKQYLPEADAVFQANGGLTGWAGEAELAQRGEHRNHNG